MTSTYSIPHLLPAFVGWQACFAHMEVSVSVIRSAKANRRIPMQGCDSMTD